jgi:protein phosphatase
MDSIYTANNKLSVSYGGYSSAGTKEINQDAFLVYSPTSNKEKENKGIAACIADGVSCSAQGQQASQTAVVQFINDYYSTPDSWGVKRSVSKVLTALNSWLYYQGSQQTMLHDQLICTFSCIVFKGTSAHIFHVGDSRVYLYRDDKLQLLTRDHQRKAYGSHHYLTRALGIDSRLDVDYLAIKLETNDLFLLTTDGIHDNLDPNDIAASLSKRENSFEAVGQDLAQKALSAQSKDNLSSLLLCVDHLELRSHNDYLSLLNNQNIPPALNIGNKIDQFEVLDVIHNGTRSHVYKVIDKANNSIKVLKTLSESLSEDPDAINNFLRERWVASQLNHPQLMKYYPQNDKSKFIYNIYEFSDGYTLRQWIRDHRNPPLNAVREIITSIVKAVRVLQRLNIVHCDLKPDNIILQHDGSIKIIDYGAAFSLDKDCIFNGRVNVPLGEANYLAPEAILKSDYSHQTDLYAIAVITYEMLTGKLPYQSIDSQSLTRARHHKWHYTPLPTHREDIPLWFDAAIRRACTTDKKSRYSVFSEFLIDIAKPNQQLISTYTETGLINTNPILFWKLSTLLISMCAVIELLLLIQRQ